MEITVAVSIAIIVGLWLLNQVFNAIVSRAINAVLDKVIAFFRRILGPKPSAIKDSDAQEALPSLDTLIASSALYSLPPDITDFTGRVDQMTEVTGLLERAVEGGGTAVVISAVAGMAGVGKSALAIHAAHQLKDSFPDGQLYVNLRGAEGEPLDPFDVLAGFLRDQGIDDQSMPKDLPGRGNLYRSQLTDKQALVLLDNAKDEAQVRPLLPGSPTCAVLITSRQSLDALEGATPLNLAVMTKEEALDLLGRLAGRERITAEKEAAKRIAELCGYLPLALRIAGGRLRSRPKWTMGDYAKRLSDERRRLEQLQLGDLDVRASFTISYGELSPEDARLFRLLGLLVGQDFEPRVAAALLGSEQEEAEDAVERLVDAQLLEPADQGRYRFHDLVRLFARDCLAQEETEEASQAARLRVVEWYLGMSGATGRLLEPEPRRQQAKTLVEQTDQSFEAVERGLTLTALTWFETEYTGLLAAVDWAHRGEAWEPVWRLASNLYYFFEIRARWADWERTHQLALEATRQAGDREAESVTLGNLGLVYLNQGRWDEAIEHYQTILTIFPELGDRHGEAQILNSLGIVYRNMGRWDEAIEQFQASLTIKRELGDRHGEAQNLNNLGIAYAQQDRLDEAIEQFRASLTIKRERGDRRGEGKTLTNLGSVYREQVRWDEAIECYEQGLAICREMGDRHGEGLTLLNMGVLYVKRGQPEKAVPLWQEALAKLHPDSPDHKRVSEWLEAAE